jgi:hypothetical protein
MISMFTDKNKLAPKHRSLKILLRKLEDVPQGETRWDFTQANIDLLFGPNCPFKPEHYKSGGGWYNHSALTGGKSVHKAEFIDLFYDHEELLMETREALRIRGFGFKFETDYDRFENGEGEEAPTSDES